MIQPVCGLAGRSEVEIQVLKSLGLSFSQDSLLVTFTGAHTGLFSNIYTVPVSQIPTPHGHVLSPLIMVMATQIPTATDSFKFSLLQGTHQYSYSVPQSCDSITHGQPQCAMVYHHTWYPLTYADLCSIRLYVGMSCCFTLHPASAPSPRAAKFPGIWHHPDACTLPAQVRTSSLPLLSSYVAYLPKAVHEPQIPSGDF